MYLKKAGGGFFTAFPFRGSRGKGRDLAAGSYCFLSTHRRSKSSASIPEPLKWFEIGQCFRYEKPQKGRGREFHQFNVDMLGEAGPGADAELIALAIETMLFVRLRGLGISSRVCLIEMRG